MVFRIDGVDMTPYVAFGGFRWQRNDVDASNAGRDLAATMHRNRVAVKDKIDTTCRLMTSAEAKLVLTTILPEYVTVEYYHPQLGEVVTQKMYSNNTPATFQIERPDGTIWWAGITFPLVEQ